MNVAVFGGMTLVALASAELNFASIIAFYWVIPTLLMGFGFEAVKDRWLSQERWDDFVRKIHEEPSGESGPAE